MTRPPSFPTTPTTPTTPARHKPVPWPGRQLLARARRWIASGPGLAQPTVPLRPLLRLDDHILRDIGVPGHEAPTRHAGPHQW